MLDLENDAVFETALLSSLGAPVRPEASGTGPSTEVRAHLGELFTAEVSECEAVALPGQRVSTESYVTA